MGDQATEKRPTPENATMMQAFEWNVPGDQKHWTRLRDHAESLKAFGVDNIWLPPGCKASSPNGVGYDIYDLYDLGEFDQKGSRATKWGTKEELMQLIDKTDELGMGVYWDAVLNHKAAADHKERCRVVEVDSNDRTKEISEPYEIDGWLGFDFPGRGDKYSSQKYHWDHFSGTDFNAENNKVSIYKILGDNKHWSDSVANEQGNADYMMFADLDYAHPEVQKDVIHWGEWIIKETRIKGFRLDAVQHYSEDFMNDFVHNIEKTIGEGIFFVGEYWVGDVKAMTAYLDRMQHKFSLFDSALLYNFSRISTTEDGDLTKIFDDSLVQVEPVNAVTVVTNHDTQKGQTMDTPIEPFFKPLAYSLILLRSEGYPCLFYGDLYGTKGEHAEGPSCGGKLADITLARKLYAYGRQDNYFDYKTCIGWVRLGTWDHPFGLACVMSNAGPGEKEMFVGEVHAGEVWTDVLGWETSEVQIGKDGKAMFPCPGTSVAIWVNKEAEGRDRFGKFDANIYKE
ncbi:MAG: hypothetical protein M1819_006247 [Sarea resinae]|nr:MAG: hypothetical protein M1819_006247 [Sarea resinae]